MRQATREIEHLCLRKNSSSGMAYLNEEVRVSFKPDAQPVVLVVLEYQLITGT